ncbi:MAG TPA: hypothetical protein VJG90_06045 [Candidatus Nanoarchaeia archaeon]|nr:hypothetical protein [Candidatus Nanoarchaeia archaeon]
MQVELSKETSNKLEKAAQALGTEKNKLIEKAIQHYLESLKQHAHLKQEMNAWDALSDEALVNFEKAL